MSQGKESVVSVVEVERPQVESPVRVVDPRVERSARILDELHPGWADEVNLDDFDIQNPHRCVLAYVYRGRFTRSRGSSFARGFRDLHRRGYPMNELAFANPSHNPDWRLEIQARKTR